MNNKYEFYTFESFEADFNTKRRPCIRHKQAEEKLVHQILAYGDDFVIIAEMFNDKYMYRILEKKVSFTDLYENYEWTDGTPCGTTDSEKPQNDAECYCVIKDGRSVSDYDNIEDAKFHAEQIEGEVATKTTVSDDNAAINLSKSQYELLIDETNERFLPCPFCGEKPRVVGVFNGDDDDEFTTVKLLHENENCPAAQWIDEKEGMVELDKLGKLIEWWNQRHI